MRRLAQWDVWNDFPPALLSGFAGVALLIVWAVADGGYFPGTWYWGALLTLALLTVTVLGLGSTRPAMPRAARVALVAFGLYVLWSYLSMSWALYPGAALEGSNRALLYWLVFALFAVLPWTEKAALAALSAFVLGVGTIAVVVMVRLATGDHVGALFISGRLASPTGYYNATAALYTMAALVAIALAVRRELPVALRAVLLAIAAVGLQLAVIGQSRGWLFTLPLVALFGIMVLSGRLRVVLAATVPVLATLAVLHRLLDVYRASNDGYSSGHAFTHAATNAGRGSLVVCAAVLVVGALLALADSRLPPVELSKSRRRAIGMAIVAVVVGGSAIGATAATHGRPFHYVAKEWDGFSHVESQTAVPSSNFAAVGSGRYDFWRVGLDAFLAHPIGGLGQDNFLAYYLRHRRTNEEPEWTHSLEIRMLTHTGLVGFALFVTFLIAALIAALGAARRAGPLGRAVAGTALLPLAVWTLHGSVDWFWEFPALSGAALAFLAMATALARPAPSEATPRTPRVRIPVILLRAGSALAVGTAAVVLAVPYLSVAEAARAGAISASDPVGALRDYARAAKLDPLSSEPGLDAGNLALALGRYGEAEQRLGQAITREPGELWEAWLGEGLAASALGDRARARHDYLVSRSINPLQPVTHQALARLRSRSPLRPREGLRELQEQN